MLAQFGFASDVNRFQHRRKSGHDDAAKKNGPHREPFFVVRLGRWLQQQSGFRR
ncbi:MAG: hypothetical protein JWP47_2971 [Polaromonas sp.]|jgi:hypothetical protein|nr:hypothetical protein [Polaromonas sp.]